MAKQIFVICEYKYNSNIFRDGSFELLGRAYEMALEAKEKYNEDFEVCAVVMDCGIDADFGELAKYGAQKIIYLKNSRFQKYSLENYCAGLKKLLETKNPEVVLFCATHIARELAPKVTSSIKTGLTADCTALELAEEKGQVRLAATRPTFGGALMATIMCRKNPQCATVREKVFGLREHNLPPAVCEEFLLEDNIFPQIRLNSLEFILKIKNEIGLDNAKVVFAGGLGLKTKENFEKMAKLAEKFNASPAASRAAVEAGFAPQSLQVGQTGKTVAPDVYFAFGISGAIHHIAGMSSSKIVVGVNTDENAPIFECCDYKIVADANVVIDEMLKQCQDED